MKRFTLYLLLATLAVTAGTGCKKKPKPEDPPGGGQVDLAKCGNQDLDNGEACDDGNKDAGDGCSDTCQIETGYSCPTVGQLCVKDPDSSNPIAKCGDSTIDSSLNEACDDGNTDPGDGCSDTCQIEQGYTCQFAGRPCVKTSEMKGCGNGKVETDLGETCDDGDTVGGDGCSSTCQLEAGWNCPKPGEKCTNTNSDCGNSTKDPGEECDPTAPGAPDNCMPNCRLSVCGDGRKEGKEGCDDHNTKSGDGCSATCQVESGWVCEPNKLCQNQNCGNGTKQTGEECDAGKLNNTGKYGGCRVNCTLAPHCGDGFLSPGNGEECDDGNSDSGDGCSATCKIEGSTGEYDCRRAGRPCIKNTCGDSTVDQGEQCDDGNRDNGDGCSSTCQLEPGYTCSTPGQPCDARSCGDGILAGTEECDDHNLRNGDGCNQYCEIESGWYCPNPGKLCIQPAHGNGTLEPTEECDDGNHTPKDGCTDGKIDAGYKCPTVGVKCVLATCGDGRKEGYETCDDGNSDSGDGCSYSTDVTKACQVEPGYACVGLDGGKSTCHKTVCGDGTQEGDEECDDNNNSGGDGCSATCTAESVFDCRRDKNGKTVCGPTCGDGVTLTEFGEECDDGNRNAGDGCSPNCKIEPGFQCTVVGTPVGTPGKREFSIPMIIRDFKIYDWTDHDGTTTHGHRDFGRRNKTSKQTCMGGHPNTQYVEEYLGPDGKPVLRPNVTCFGTVAKGPAGLQFDENHAWSLLWFYRWYHDFEQDGTTPNKFAKRLTYNLHFKEVPPKKAGDPPTDTYVNWVPDPQHPDDVTKLKSADNNDFFPIDGKGWKDVENGHNYYFTTEFTAYFKYKGGERLDFIGDDDLWVFINGKLAVDLGGLNNSIKGSVTLSDKQDPLKGVVYDRDFNLYAGGVYEIKVFHAERHITESKYKLTLAGFVSFGISQCAPVCGDGKVAYGHEECDLGSGNSDAQSQSGGKYTSGCSTTCKNNPGWFCTGSPSVCNETNCGDGEVQFPEQCDLGPGQNGPGKDCTADCKLPHCGDGNVDPGETCDYKNDPNCTYDCRRAQCNNGVPEAPVEECDDGNNDNTDGCTNNCKLPICGDGIVQPSIGERCDGQNDGKYGTGHCTLDCQGVAPYCGDGIVQADKGEQCDDGTNNGTSGYGACSSDCKIVSYCGDGKLASPEEECDDGNNDDGDGCSSCKVDSGYYCCTSKGPNGECNQEPDKETTCQKFG